MSKKRRPSNHGDRESRRRKTLERLGTESPHCLACGEENPHCLELHHPAGDKHDDETIILCSNHHDVVTDAQKDHPEIIEGCTSPLEDIAHWLFGLGELAGLAADELKGTTFEALLRYIALKSHAIGQTLFDMAKTTLSGEPGGVS